jgi:23S rRNA pseudouridine2605 synthase
MERLQKVLAYAGVGSRRECETLISQGRVTVNGTRVTELGTKIDPEATAIKVNGKRVHLSPEKPTTHYFMVYKPTGYLTTMKPDPQQRRTLLDLLKGRRIKSRVYPVGRLDFNSEGLLLLTNDGELAYRLTHPRFKVPKTYEVKVHGIPSAKDLRRLSQGIKLEEGKTSPASVNVLRRTGKNTWLRMTISEGRKRQIRRMCDVVKLPVSKLRRIAIGPVKLAGLKRGQIRPLQADEIQSLKKAVNL